MRAQALAERPLTPLQPSGYRFGTVRRLTCSDVADLDQPPAAAGSVDLAAPPTDGRSNEGWEKIWTFGMGAGIAIIVLGHIYSPAATCVRTP